MSMVESEVSDY